MSACNSDIALSSLAIVRMAFSVVSTSNAVRKTHSARRSGSDLSLIFLAAFKRAVGSPAAESSIAAAFTSPRNVSVSASRRPRISRCASTSPIATSWANWLIGNSSPYRVTCVPEVGPITLMRSPRLSVGVSIGIWGSPDARIPSCVGTAGVNFNSAPPIDEFSKRASPGRNVDQANSKATPPPMRRRALLDFHLRRCTNQGLIDSAICLIEFCALTSVR